jgi:hypothetical protein
MLLDENSSNLLGLFWVQTLSTLDFLSILEYNDGWEFLELEVLLCSWEFLNIDLECRGVMSVTLGSPIIKTSVWTVLNVLFRLIDTYSSACGGTGPIWA